LRLGLLLLLLLPRRDSIAVFCDLPRCRITGRKLLLSALWLSWLSWLSSRAWVGSWPSCPAPGFRLGIGTSIWRSKYSQHLSLHLRLSLPVAIEADEAIEAPRMDFNMRGGLW
jgi:hypothetical protein